MNPNYLYVNWLDFHYDTKNLAKQLSNLRSWQGIIAITRGGLVPAAVLASALDIRFIDTICLSSYSNDHRQDDMYVIKTAQQTTQEKGKDLIVVDDLVDSGRTLSLVRAMLPDAYYVSVYAKPAGKKYVDTFSVAVDQNTWIVFPWEADTNKPL
jgi:xanthine phosphoribosyltransferase